MYSMQGVYVLEPLLELYCSCLQGMPVLEFVGLWQERLAAVQAVGCSYADSTLAFKLLGEKFLQMQMRAPQIVYGRYL